MAIKRKKPVPPLPHFKKILRVQIYGIKSTKQFHKDIVTRGLLPQISVSATEVELQNEICQLVHSCTIPTLGEKGPKDFHFINEYCYIPENHHMLLSNCTVYIRSIDFRPLRLAHVFGAPSVKPNKNTK